MVLLLRFITMLVIHPSGSQTTECPSQQQLGVDPHAHAKKKKCCHQNPCRVLRRIERSRDGMRKHGYRRYQGHKKNTHSNAGPQSKQFCITTGEQKEKRLNTRILWYFFGTSFSVSQNVLIWIQRFQGSICGYQQWRNQWWDDQYPQSIKTTN